jgi:uncharacterized protein (TIGR00645 family)
MTRLARLERAIEFLLFGSRWLLVPFYLGLAVGLVLVLGKFVLSAVELVLHGLAGSEDHFIIGILGLIDLSLVANLLLMVMFAGYQNFVGPMHLDDHPDRPDWIGHVGFAEIKLKLLTSIVAIAAIHVLEDFMDAPTLENRALAWRAGLLLLFVVSGVMMALMDRISKDPAGSGH